MNRIGKLLMILPAILKATKSLFSLGRDDFRYSASTPRIPGGGNWHRGRTQAHVPNDGHWHMKHHRSRG